MKKISAAYNKLADALDKAVYVIGGAGIIVCAGMCLIWATYIGMGILFRVNGHCSMDFIVNALPPKAQNTLRIFTDIAILVVCVLTVRYSWALAIKSFSKKLILIKLPYFWVDIPITIGYAHLLLLVIGDIVIRINRLIHWDKE